MCRFVPCNHWILGAFPRRGARRTSVHAHYSPGIPLRLRICSLRTHCPGLRSTDLPSQFPSEKSKNFVNFTHQLCLLGKGIVLRACQRGKIQTSGRTCCELANCTANFLSTVGKFERRHKDVQEKGEKEQIKGANLQLKNQTWRSEFATTQIFP